ncbi:hypothetical protein [Actinoplanes teichomyceticus]|uniref:hypothetical protein n=1 Tax=Actinoplanes teichomyceticus TaxID=1867 RepID=UPI0011A665DB|nr:hypothetical protein [Actinoplanes teichomyceticus]GIF13540.1 hypothetical protein Ate01nite_35720 [Actinoplanes teichomyceticus]
MPLVEAIFGYRRKHILLTPLTDDDLERITTPTLMPVGGHSQLYDAREVVATVPPACRAPSARSSPKPATTWSCGIPTTSPHGSSHSPRTPGPTLDIVWRRFTAAGNRHPLQHAAPTAAADKRTG